MVSIDLNLIEMTRVCGADEDAEGKKKVTDHYAAM